MSHRLWLVSLVALPLAAFAHSELESMCLARQPELAILAQAEQAQMNAHFDVARKQLERVVALGHSDLAARAAFRLAEIDEELLWANPLAAKDIHALLEGVQTVRTSFLKVTKYGDPFWNSRAAFRVLSLLDDLMGRLQSFVTSNPLLASVSPFSVVFSHHFVDTSLNRHLVELERERSLVEAALLDRLETTIDKPLVAALKARAAEGMSPYFGQAVMPPWEVLPEGLLIKSGKSYYRLGRQQTVTPVPRALAISAMREALKHLETPLPFAFALAHLADEQQEIPSNLVITALQSPDSTVRLAGLYAAQKSPAHQLTSWILSLWPKGRPPVLFGTTQQLLFGERERIMLALSTHFALGRESTHKILASNRLHDEEKAWLLRFRKDRTTVAYAEGFLQHENALVKTRTEEAMRAWNS